MKAMVLAAGVGSRLRPLTDHCPKALVEIAGVPMIEIVLRRLAAVGVRDVVVNVFHHAERVQEFLRGCTHLDLSIRVAREAELLDTGGGLKNVSDFFAGSSAFFLHNVDVVSSVDLLALYEAHRDRGAMATLSVRDRPASRMLLLDSTDRLCGWERPDTAERRWASTPVAPVTRVGFDGIQVLSPQILEKLVETGPFSLTQAYLRLAGLGEHIAAHRADDSFWADIGSVAKLEAVERHVAMHGLPA